MAKSAGKKPAFGGKQSQPFGAKKGMDKKDPKAKGNPFGKKGK